MKTGTGLRGQLMSARTLLLVITFAAVAMAVTLAVQPGSGTAPAAADNASAPAPAGYIKIGDIKGEATDSAHKDWINLLSVSQSITRPMSSGISGSTRQRGAATFGDIVVVKEIDKSSPKLQESVATGQVFPRLELELASPSSTKSEPYLRYELTNVIVTNYRVSGSASGDPLPTETISLNYEEIKVTYTEVAKDGSKGGNVEYTWKVEEGTN